MIQDFIRQWVLLISLLCYSFYSHAQCEAIDSLMDHAKNFEEVFLEDRVETLEKAIFIAQECKDTVKTIDAIISLSREFGNVGNYQASFKNFWKGLLLADESKDAEKQFRLYLIIGRSYGYLKRPEKAIEFFDKANKLSGKFEENYSKANFRKFQMLLNYVSMYREFNQFDKVGQYIDSCELVMQKDMSDASKFYFKTEKAVYLNHLGEHSSALLLLSEAFAYFSEKKPNYLVLVNTFIGDVYLNKLDYSKSEDYYLSAIEISNSNQKHVSFTPLIYDRLSRLYKRIGNYKSALDAANRSVELNFNFFDSRSPMNTSLLQVHDDFKVFKAEQEEFRKNQELETLLQNKRLLTLQRLLLLATLIFSLLFAYLYFKWQKNRIEKEKEHNSLIEREYRVKKELSEKLAFKNEELITYSHIMSHDLKAPLNTIMSFSGLLQKQIIDKSDDSRNVDYINFISSSSNSMSQLIDDLLLYSKLESDEVDLKEISLEDLVTKVVDSFQFDINKKGASIDIQDLPKVKGNDAILKTVFHNLISNGLKYQPIDKKEHTPKIKIWSSSDPEENVIYIKDNGIGFSENSKESLFVPFKRFHAASEYKGTGLGMSICKRIMGSHNGDIDLLETSEHGSTFKLTFPN